MAAVKHARGVALVIKVGDGGSPEDFVAKCSINGARSFTATANTNDFVIPDCTDPTAIANIVREKASLSYAISGAGILNTPDLASFNTWLAQASSKNCQVIVDVPGSDGGAIWQGAFHLTQFEITGDQGNKIEFTCQLLSDGPVTISTNSP
jgi:hypothetical protein